MAIILIYRVSQKKRHPLACLITSPMFGRLIWKFGCPFIRFQRLFLQIFRLFHQSGNPWVTTPFFSKFEGFYSIYTNGYFNSKNCIHCGPTRPSDVIEKCPHPLKITVWCAICSAGIFEAYFMRRIGEMWP